MIGSSCLSDSLRQGGLDRAIVKHMVQHMGGSLAIDSREGVGTTVRLVFPPPISDG